MVDVITSRDNPRVKRFIRLCADSRQRRESGLLALEGARLCQDAVSSGSEIELLLYTKRAEEQYASAVDSLRAVARECQIVSEAVATHLGETEHPQGVFCLVRRPSEKLDVSALCPTGRYLALENVRDPGNLGTIIRTAEAFGADGLLLSEGCCDPYSPKVLRGSMGGALRLPLAIVPDLPAALTAWQRQGLVAYACVASGEAQRLTEVTLGAGNIPVIGNEGDGLTAAAIAACQRRLTIPMSGRAESLNAAMAAGIVLWELTRPRGDVSHG